jgi:glycosyltransferase involved in cell wall biosynthesis
VRVSIILATLNEEQYIRACLNSLIDQKLPHGVGLEVLVADGGSTDLTRTILDEYCDRHSFIRWLDNPKRIPAAGWNVCLRSVTGDVVVLMGAHTTAPPNFIGTALKVLNDIPDASCVGGLVETKADTFLQKVFALSFTCPFAIGNARYRYAAKPQFVETINYGAYRREVFDKVGMFNEELRRDDDWEFNFRMGKAGLKLYYDPDIRITYYPRASWPGLWRQHYGNSFFKVRVLQLHKESLLVRHVVPFLFVLGLAGGLLLALFFPTIRIIWLAMIAVYLGSSVFFSIRTAGGHGLGYVVTLPLVFLWVHLGHGVGFAAGILRYFTHWRRAGRQGARDKDRRA